MLLAVHSNNSLCNEDALAYNSKRTMLRDGVVACSIDFYLLSVCTTTRKNHQTVRSIQRIFG
eukprot:scaffold607_cov109-Cylindrotheca_fusiformis.AAC.5